MVRPLGPWWVGAFAEGGCSYVIKFKIDGDGRPLTVEFLAPAGLTPSGFLQRRALSAACQFCRENAGLVRDALGLARGEQPGGVLTGLQLELRA